MILRATITVVLVAGTLLLSHGANAGGWASVRLADGQSAPVVGETWHAELIVRQHDEMEVDVDELSIRFTHQESKSALSTMAESTGQLGHYALEVVLDKPGIWDWIATPAPFGPMTMESLEVLGTAATSDPGGPSVTIVRGTCIAPGEQLGEIDLTESDSLTDNDLATGILPNFDDLITTSPSDAIAVIIRDATADRTQIACGELSASGLSTPQVLVFEPETGSDTVGTMSLVPDGDGVTATVTVMTQLPGQGVLIRITDAGEGMFAPGSITVPAGTTVTWQNDGSIAHTVAGTTDGFLSSSMLDHGERFSQTFDEAGVYPYACGPHTWMTGTITVVE